LERILKFKDSRNCSNEALFTIENLAMRPFFSLLKSILKSLLRVLVATALSIVVLLLGAMYPGMIAFHAMPGAVHLTVLINSRSEIFGLMRE